MLVLPYSPYRSVLTRMHTVRGLRLYGGISMQLYITGSSSSSVSVEDLRVQRVRIMQLLDLSTILPLIQKRNIVHSEDYEKVADTKHHGSIEHTGYLLHALYKQGQDAVDQFV